MTRKNGTPTLADFRPQRRNASKHTARGMRELENSIQRDGVIGGATFAANGESFDGSARLEVLATVLPDAAPIVVHSDGTRPVFVVRDDIPTADDPRAVRLGVAANRIAELNLDYDADVLREIAEAEAEMLRGLFTGDELAEHIGRSEPPDDPGAQVDRAAELQAKWGTALGQLWQIGEHRLACGDCTDAAVVARVMDGEKAEMVFTDPPYGHNNNDGDLIHNREAALGRSKTKSSAPRPIANDGPEANALVRRMFAIAADLLKPGCCCCCCCCGGGGPDPQFARWSLWLDEVIPFKMCVVWDKGGLGMGWHYRRNWECILVAQKPGAPTKWYGGHDVPNVIRDIGKIIPSAEQHPTEKPVELAEWFLKLHSTKDDVVLDPFAGSGTTGVACERLSRRARMIEIDPGYCGVILERMAGLGVSPKLVS